MPTLRLLLVRLFPALGGGSSYGGSGEVISRRIRIDWARTLDDLASISKPNGAQPDNSVDAVLAKPRGAVCHQTFGLQYDDEAILVQGPQRTKPFE
jgi:hypothetical protein